MVDTYYNSGRFNLSLSYLISKNDNPFHLFEALVFFKNNTIARDKVNNAEQYEFLYEFYKSLGPDDINIFKEFLAFDYLKQGRNPIVPSFLNSEEGVDKNYMWEFLSSEENIIKYLPHYEGLEVKKIIKNIYYRFFRFDMCTFANCGKVELHDTIVVFDYKNSKKSEGVKYFCIPYIKCIEINHC